MKTLFLILLIAGCTSMPKGINAINAFEINRYLGHWYEIARLDNRFERGLDHISATYTLREDGGVSVANQGRNIESGEWHKALGKAYFIEDKSIGRLKVSFFGPFYSAYNIIALDKQQYSYAMIAGSNKSSLWILSRTPKLPPAILQALITQAKALGFATDELILGSQ